MARSRYFGRQYLYQCSTCDFWVDEGHRYKYRSQRDAMVGYARSAYDAGRGKQSERQRQLARKAARCWDCGL